MVAVIFEVELSAERKQEYLELASQLRAELEHIDGFLSVERFASLSQEGKILSLSFWRDEKAIQQWRELDAHRRAQAKGRQGVFEGYRLRVAEIKRDYGMLNREQAPADSRSYHIE